MSNISNLHWNTSFMFIEDTSRADSVNSLRPWQNGRCFTDDNCKLIFFNKNCSILIYINNKPSLVQIMAYTTGHYLSQWRPIDHNGLICVSYILVIIGLNWILHCNDVIMGEMASQITSLTIVYSTVYSDADQRKHQSSASLAFVRGIHRGPVNSPHKWPVTRKMVPFDDVIMTV